MPKRLATSLAVVVLSACTVEVDQSTNGQAPCSAETYELIENHIKISDAEGHGPDLGSSEWMSAVERRLGVDEDVSAPHEGTQAWCAYVIDRQQRAAASLRRQLCGKN